MKSIDPLAGISVFLHVADQLSFSAVAEQLGLSRATVSAQVSELEKRLGVRLLQRSTRQVSLTEAGKAYAAALGGVLDQTREAERVAVSYQTEAIGRIRVAAPTEFGQRYIAPFLTEFMRLQPALAIELDLSPAPVDLIAGGFDLAIRGTFAVGPNLIVRKLGVSPVVMVASPDYLGTRQAPARPSALIEHDCLHFAPLRWGRMWVMTRKQKEERVSIRPRLEVNDAETLRRAALAGLGVALLPTYVVGDDLRSGKLRQILPDWHVATLTINAVYPANRNIAVKVKAFVAFLAAKFAELPDLRG